MENPEALEYVLGVGSTLDRVAGAGENAAFRYIAEALGESFGNLLVDVVVPARDDQRRDGGIAEGVEGSSAVDGSRSPSSGRT